MELTKYIRDTINRLPLNYTFTSDDFTPEVGSKEGVVKALNRLVQEGRISKLSKGIFYKPEQTPFGTLEPPFEQIVKDLLKKDGKVTGYLTGLSVYPGLGLTTQISNTIQVGKKEVRQDFQRGKYTISIIRQKNTITEANIPLLQILDALRYIKKIPDAQLSDSISRLKLIIKDLSNADQNELIRLAKKYNPATRALLGAILEDLGRATAAQDMWNSLNSLTVYEIPGAGHVLQSTERWNIR